MILDFDSPLDLAAILRAYRALFANPCQFRYWEMRYYRRKLRE